MEELALCLEAFGMPMPVVLRRGLCEQHARTRTYAPNIPSKPPFIVCYSTWNPAASTRAHRLHLIFMDIYLSVHQTFLSNRKKRLVFSLRLVPDWWISIFFLPFYCWIDVLDFMMDNLGGSADCAGHGRFNHPCLCDTRDPPQSRKQ